MGPATSATANTELLRMLRVDSTNMQPRSVGFGDMSPGSFVGPLNAVVAEIPVSGATGIYTVQHNLGQVPTVVFFVGINRPQDLMSTDIFAMFAPVNVDKWTDTAVQVSIYHIGVASLDRCSAKFIIGGA